jgi:heme exporter protein D
MIWESWQDFFAMDGYALYVWGSVVVCFIAVIGELWLLSAQWKAIKASIRRMTASMNVGTNVRTNAGGKGNDESKA